LPWAPAYTTTFRRDYKNLSQADQQRVNQAIREILNSDEPRSLGRPKPGKWKGAYGYDIGGAILIIKAIAGVISSSRIADLGSNLHARLRVVFELQAR